LLLWLRRPRLAEVWKTGHGQEITFMSADRFMDTNVLVYAFDSQSPEKQKKAQAIIKQADFVTSAQVLGELYVTLTNKLDVKVPVVVASQAIEELRAMSVVTTSASLVMAAIETSVSFQLSNRDALIVEAAVLANCSTLLTEDLNQGQVIKGVQVLNPFQTINLS